MVWTLIGESTVITMAMGNMASITAMANATAMAMAIRLKNEIFFQTTFC